MPCSLETPGCGTMNRSIQIARPSLRAGVLLVLAIVISLAGCACEEIGQLTAYEHLTRNGFPLGILPHTVKSYDLDEKNGKFTLYLQDKCSFSITNGNIPVYYANKITGVMREGSLKNLAGIQAKAFKMWWSISGIEVKEQDLVLKSGFTSKTFPKSNFKDVPACEGISLAAS